MSLPGVIEFLSYLGLFSVSFLSVTMETSPLLVVRDSLSPDEAHQRVLVLAWARIFAS